MSACGWQQSSPTLFKEVSSSQTGITFTNQLQPVSTNNILEYDYFYMGGGVAAADFDNDGLTDLYFSGNQVSGKLYRNTGKLRFEDITESAGVTTSAWCSGVAVADVNADGWADIYVCHAGLNNTPNQLFINQGKQPDGSIRFRDEAPAYGVAYKGFTTQAAFLDYDKDGDLDLYLLTHFHEKVNPNYPKFRITDGSAPSTDRLYRNDGNGRFTDVTILAGVTTEGFGLGIAVSDINGDGWPDVYVANDFAYDDNLYLNQQGTFIESAHRHLRHTSRFSMGCDVADFNNDSYPDILTVDMMPDDNKRQKLMGMGTTNDLFNLSLRQGYLPQYARNMLQLNNGDGSFSEIGQLAGIFKTDWSWSALFADLDNDGWKDIYITNGIPRDITDNDFTAFRDAESQMMDGSYEVVRERLLKRVEELEPVDKPNFAFRNQGGDKAGDLTFADQGEAWGLAKRGFSNGAVYADLDNDGDLDLVTNNLNEPASVFENRSEQFSKHHFFRLKLSGHVAAGAKVRVVTGRNEQFAEYNPYRGFQSSQEPYLHFGLGKAAQVDTLEVIWPDGRRQVQTAIPADTLLALAYQQAGELTSDFAFGRWAQPQEPALFKTLPLANGLSFVHQENEYEDFNNEPLLPHRFSRNGPYLATGDLNGDGRDDIWIGGPARTSGSLFFQQANGQFTTRPVPDPGFEDMGGTLLDADGDGDLDLYVVSGGNEYNPLTAAYQDRLYMNDGKGNFVRDKAAVPVEYASGSCARAADYDKDGDLDLFVGGRVVPNRYPELPESFLLRNKGQGRFESATAEAAPDLSYVGMVTDAVWVDIDRDTWPDLVVVGEFMPVTIFHNEAGRLKRWYQSAQTGWWMSVAAGDFDQDGDPDLVVGNWGLNNRLKPTAEQPVSLYAVPFPGGVQPLLSYYLNGEEVPVLGRDALVSRFPVVKKKFLTYNQFAKAAVSDLFGKEELQNTLQANSFASVYMENTGKGSDGALNWNVRPLPMPAQLAPITGMGLGDFNADGNLDVLTIGNQFSPDYLTGRYDATCGLLMLGNGKGEFRPLRSAQSGIHLSGDMKALAPLQISGKKHWLVGTNSAPLQQLVQQKAATNSEGQQYARHYR
ncbi:VCBS repeat-containing protein [Nibrella saemangeumensis]|uniref:VCBS repeat-containing protein n=2 Tax=Nibrella saemangeumensis TaxID=1084526 RepID=A0ABP8MWI3_9BACT